MSNPWSTTLTPAQIEAAKTRKKAWSVANADRLRSKKRAYYADNKEYFYRLERDRKYKKLYGISLDDYERMLEDQGGCCAICRSPEAGRKGQAFAVDHCHTRGSVRGLLCIKCNVRLGWLEKHKLVALDYLAGRVLGRKPSKHDRYRLKDVQAYRDRKNIQAKTPKQRAKRAAYARAWRAKNKVHANAYARERKAKAKSARAQ